MADHQNPPSDAESSGPLDPAPDPDLAPDTDPAPDPGSAPDAGPAPDVGPALAPAPEPPAVGRFGRRTVLGAGLAAVAGTLGVAAFTAPRPASLGEPTGDDAITDALAGPLAGHRRVAIALLDEGAEPRFAGFGADESEEFEIGSITKVFNGALLAGAISRGEVTLETTVAEVLGEEAEGSPIADVTFAELATHSAGLPTVAPSRSARFVASIYLNNDPYGSWDADQLVADALGTAPTTRGQHVYSNLSVALEGQLLARLAEVPYEELVTTEVIEPLGLDATYAPITPDDLRETAQRGHTATGRRTAAWTLNGYAPAGCMRSTANDLATFVTATRDGTAPGADAAGEVLLEQDDYTGLSINWIHSQLSNDSTVIWHNGVTGGYAAFAGWDTASGRGVVLLSDTATAIEGIAFEILTGEIAL